MSKQIISIFCLPLCVSLCMLTVGASSADAKWAHEECTHNEKHCYAVSEWRPKKSAEIFNAWSYIDTEEMYLPEIEEGFVSNELWTSWKKPSFVWIEAGQVYGEVGDWEGSKEPEQLRAFYGFFYDNRGDTEGFDLNGPPVPFDSRNLYQVYSDVPGFDEAEPGEDWCIKFGGPLYPASQEDTVACEKGRYHYGPATVLETGAEAGTEHEPASSGVAEGFAEGGREDRWQEANNNSRNAQIYTEVLNGSTCGEMLPGKYGSIRFGVGKSCGETGEHADTEGAGGFALAPSDDDPFASVPGASGGDAIPLSAVAQIADEQAARDGSAPPDGVSVSKGTLGQALETIQPGSMEVPREHAGVGQARYLSMPTDLVELHGSFTLEGIPVPRGASAPAGTVLRLLVNADTGEVEGSWLGSAPRRPIRRLGAVQKVR